MESEGKVYKCKTCGSKNTKLVTRNRERAVGPFQCKTSADYIECIDCESTEVVSERTAYLPS